MSYADSRNMGSRKETADEPMLRQRNEEQYDNFWGSSDVEDAEQDNALQNAEEVVKVEKKSSSRDSSNRDKYRDDKYYSSSSSRDKYKDDRYYKDDKHSSRDRYSEKYSSRDRDSSYRDRDYDKYNNSRDKYSSSTSSSRSDDKYRNTDKYSSSSDKYRDEKYRDDKYRDEKYRDDKYRDEKYRDDKYRDEKYRDDKYRDEKYRNEKYRNDKYRDDKYRSSDKYRDTDKYRDNTDKSHATEDTSTIKEIDTNADIYGPRAPLEDTKSALYTQNLLKGEGQAIAEYVKSGVRIPRRGEIGLAPQQIKNFENTGYVMSGSRHSRMNAIRIRKENQIYSAEEQQLLAKVDFEEKMLREQKVMAELHKLIEEE